MAKSLRSKWKRKMKAVKRVRYGKKELERLKTVLEKAKENDGKNDTDVAMLDESQLYTVVPLNQNTSTNEENCAEEENGQMDVDGNKVLKIYDPVTMKDQFGNLPFWLSSHRRKKIKRSTKKIAKQKRKIEKKKNRARKNF